MSKYDEKEIIKNPCDECNQDLDWLEESDAADIKLKWENEKRMW